MTTSTSPSEWFHHFYSHPNPAAPPPSAPTLSGQPSESTVVSTTTTDNYSLGQVGMAASDSFLSGLSQSPTTNAVSGRPGPTAQETRVSRPARRRSRASRKNPTTLLNTDTTNFRAMVQRYTGGTSMTYSPLESASPTGFGGGFHQGQMSNFSHLHGSMAGVDLRATQLHQQLLMQQHGFASTANMSASSARGEEGFSSGLGPQAALQGSDQLYSSSMGGNGDDNKRGGFMF